MSLGYEICFGYNYQKLNDTVSEPVQKLIKDEVEDIYRIGQTSCQISQEEKRPLTQKGEIDYNQERKMIQHCKKYFDLVATAFTNEYESVGTLLDEKDYLLKNFYDSQEDLMQLKNQIENKLAGIRACKDPEIVTREKLINKYLAQFLT